MNQQINYKRTLPLMYRLLKRFEIHRLQKVAQLIPQGKLSVLEIGCGDGQFLYDNRSKWKKIIGVDISPSLLLKAEKRNYKVSARFDLADYGVSPMPYKSNQFDIVVSIATMQYTYNIDLLISEIYRVLKRGGIFIFEVPNAVSFWRRIIFLSGRIPSTSVIDNGWDGGVIHYFTRRGLSSFIKAKGFTIEKVSCSGIFATLRQIWPDFLGGDLIYVCKKR